MKQYVAINQLRIVGRGWEVRHQLRKLAAASKHGALVSDYTKNLPPLSLKLSSTGGRASSKSAYKRK